jgi:archaemetzincin
VSDIYLLPLGSADRLLVSQLRSPLTETFRATVRIRELDLDLERFFNPSRAQYNSTDILHHVLDQCTTMRPAGDSSPKYLAVLSEDLFIPILTYVFGEAQLSGEAAVVSYHRLQSELYGLPKDPDLLSLRLLKEARHELGHAYGLVHCYSQECVMRSSTDVEGIDLKGDAFCEECAAVLHSSSVNG